MQRFNVLVVRKDGSTAHLCNETNFACREYIKAICSNYEVISIHMDPVSNEYPNTDSGNDIQE
jgi:hypothetical protein